MIDYTALKTELESDPKMMGFAPNLADTNDAANAALLNALTGPGAQVQPLQFRTHDQFALMIAPAVMALGMAATALQTKWTPMLHLLSGVQNVALDATIMLMLNALVTDGLMTASQVTAGTTKMCSRAEVLFGIGTIAQWQDVAKAMGRG